VTAEAIPTATSTFLFTDVEGSTRLWVEQPDLAGPAFAHHDRILNGAVASAGGTVVKGTGDGLMARFDDPLAALRASVAAQRRLLAERESLGDAAGVRMAIATGPAQTRDGDFFGLTVILCSRLMAAAHAGQILLSGRAHDSIGPFPDPFGSVDLGRHRLRGLSGPLRVFQAVHPDLPAEFPPVRTLPAVPHNLPRHLTSFVGRRTEVADVDDLLQRQRLVTLTGSGGVGKTRVAPTAS
jgi:class 3 adenylate cyclase